MDTQDRTIFADDDVDSAVYTEPSLFADSSSAYCANNIRRFEAPEDTPSPPKRRGRKGLRLSKKEKALEEVLNAPHGVDFLHAARLLYRGVGTPVALSLLQALESGDYKALTIARINPSDYDDAYTFKLDYQCVSFLRKWSALPSGIDTKGVAEEAFLTAEKRCREFNQLYNRSGGLLHPDNATADMLFEARYKIASWLGPFNAGEWLTRCRFGPGSSLGITGTSDYVKLSEYPSITEELRPYLAGILEEFPAWVASLTYDQYDKIDVEVFPGGKFSTVPKDSKTDRPIEVQPLLNGFLQLGIGSMIRERLKFKAHNDISDQQVNRDLARQGSITGDIATIDLSSASDLISRELVRLLLPTDWLFAMDLCRTHTILFRGEHVPLERYASMGCGFTFELETAIFLALASVVHDRMKTCRKPRVYGDDILTHTDEAPMLMGLLEKVGFLVNQSKSFWTGPFRESCGGDFFNGTPVRPYFLKDNPENVAEVIPVVNGYARRLLGGDRVNCFDHRLVGAYAYLYRRIPLHLRNVIACGSTDADDTFYYKPHRCGKLRVVFKSRVYQELNWFPAVATALYRLWQRSRERENELDPASFTSNWKTRSYHWQTTRQWALTQNFESGDGRVTNYRRDDGVWVLRPVVYTPCGAFVPPLQR